MKIRLNLILLFTTIWLFAEKAFAQDTNLTSQAKIDLGFSGVGFSWDIPVSKKILFELAAGLGAGYSIDNGSYNYRWYLDDPSIYFTTHGKYYYNRNKKEGGKRVTLNSGNFWGLKAKYATKTINNSYNYESLLIAVHWGIQRSFSKHFSFEGYIGGGYARDFSDIDGGGSLFPDLNFKISYVLPFK